MILDVIMIMSVSLKKENMVWESQLQTKIYTFVLTMPSPHQ